MNLRLALPAGYDFDETLRFARLGPQDPCARRGPGVFVKATRTPAGPVTLRVELVDGGRAQADLWGDGASWMASRLPALLGLDDVPPCLPAGDPAARLARRFGGLRLTRLPWPLDTLYGHVLQQRIAFPDAMASHRRLVYRVGGAAPGPAGLRLPPEPAAVLRLASHDWRGLGVDRQREATLRGLFRYAHRVAETVDMTLDAARARLSALRGVGPWTLGMTMGFGFGDADAVPVGDLHLPHLVCWAFSGRMSRGSDAEMLECLAPYAGQRFRILRWLFAAGIGRPPGSGR